MTFLSVALGKLACSPHSLHWGVQAPHSPFGGWQGRRLTFLPCVLAGMPSSGAWTRGRCRSLGPVHFLSID